ncbi:hypothetical protein SAMN02745823_00464 [Sporobacter termitidis DSM 10068]|uniref:Lipoprotein n=1 Tax=Sporobacter termitidis DSM 10068 TaxID=1123282 RepID=A0A1M5UDD1_9FIRM|nr:hypothetical protein [Sporobacter termitidis]SHH60969.1 hypothetical protein SAMN02745823_00464 [Sporobacter termitidis DSM 10068]
MKRKLLLLTSVLLIALLAGCAPASNVTPSPSVSTSPLVSTGPSQTPSDTTTSASIVNTAAAFQNAIGKTGTWIICITNDMTITQDLTVDGSFMNTKTPPASQRKLAFYAQDEDRNITARYTLTAPKMTINSPDCAIWYGTFKGDLYVSADNFQLIGATVDGNVYFTSESAQSSFKMDDASKITGVKELKTA